MDYISNNKYVSTKPLVLVVEDCEVTRELVSEVLQAEGFHVVTADSVAKGIRLCKLICFCAIVTDLMLPDGTGDDIMGFVKQTSPNTQVILMTGYDSFPSKRHQGYDDYLVKPVPMDLLSDTVRACLELERKVG